MVVWSLTMVVVAVVVVVLVAVVVGLIVTGMPLTNPEICSLPLTAAACRPGCCMSLSIRAQYFISEEKVSTLYIAHGCNYRENPGYRYHVRSHGQWTDGSLVLFRTVLYLPHSGFTILFVLL